MQLEVHSVSLPLQASVPGMVVTALLSSPCFPECFAVILAAAEVHVDLSMWGSFFVLSRLLLLHRSKGCKFWILALTYLRERTVYVWDTVSKIVHIQI